MLKYCNPDGIVQVYFDHSRSRFREYYGILVGRYFFNNPWSSIDPLVCINVLTLFHKHRRGMNYLEHFIGLTSSNKLGVYLRDILLCQ